MRLVCPNCGAQYEVPDEVISSEGRDVQCSNCGITWYQPSAAALAAGETARLAGTGTEMAAGEVETDAEGDWPEDLEDPEVPDAEEADEALWDEAAEPADAADDDLFAEDDYEDEYEDDYEDGAGAPAADPTLAEKVADPVPAPTPAARDDDTVAPLDTDAADETWEDEAPEDWDTPSDDHGSDAASDDDDPEAWDEPADDDVPDATDAAGDETPAVAAAPRVTPRRPLPSDVQSVLREEAAFEARARTRSADPLESQPDLGLGEPETEAQRRDRESRERLARLRGMTAMAAGTGAAATADPAPAAAPAPAPKPAPEPAADPAQAPRRDLLPDIEEINSSLRTKGPKSRPAPGGETVVDTQDQRRGFRLGFGLVVLIGALLILFYMHAEWVKETVPALEETTDAYVRTADEFRAWLDTQAGRLQAWMEGMSE
ncbi:zinc-ribbon domain-containing protein [Pseudooceanicola sp.]|uniref:zinc-ribbon domain-containing protein n=1 Tax=Pseudooceanicola sp. TaxID=1914328 RepID=UPI0035129543